ncbi:MAG: hypothetical protein HKN42_05115, partial [Granulosicoccus sp.]|nr:hypothetical protein [Granulosicoccus sp.]
MYLPTCNLRPAFPATALLVLLSVLLCSANVMAQVSTGIAELDAPFTQFIEGRGSARTEALDTIAALERDDTRELLTGILSGDLMLHKPTGTVVRATRQGREYLMQSLDGSEELGSDSTRKLARLKVTNKMRSYLRNLIAGLGLRSANPQHRLAAINALMDTPDQLADETLVELLGSETVPAVRKALSALQARKQAVSDQP